MECLRKESQSQPLRRIWTDVGAQPCRLDSPAETLLRLEQGEGLKACKEGQEAWQGESKVRRKGNKGSNKGERCIKCAQVVGLADEQKPQCPGAAT